MKRRNTIEKAFDAKRIRENISDSETMESSISMDNTDSIVSMYSIDSMES